MIFAANKPGCAVIPFWLSKKLHDKQHLVCIACLILATHAAQMLKATKNVLAIPRSKLKAAIALRCKVVQGILSVLLISIMKNYIE